MGQSETKVKNESIAAVSTIEGAKKTMDCLSRKLGPEKTGRIRQEKRRRRKMMLVLLGLTVASQMNSQKRALSKYRLKAFRLSSRRRLRKCRLLRKNRITTSRYFNSRKS